MKCPSHLGTYEGKTDPDDFLQLFRRVEAMQQWIDPVACRAFGWVLKCDSKEWFNNLPKGSITGFTDLKEKFREYFSQQKKHKKTYIAAHNIKQGSEEESQRISGLIHGCRSRALIEHLVEKLLETFKDKKAKAYAWLDARDIAANSIGVPTQDGEPTGGKRKQRLFNNKDTRVKYSPYNKEDKGKERAVLPKLTKTPRAILEKEKVAKTFAPPPKLSNKNKKNCYEYCEFHCDHGHDTNDCINLKKAISKAIKEGELGHLLVEIRQNTKVKDEEGSQERIKVPEQTIFMLYKQDKELSDMESS
uniref:uncharacterized protein LOC122608994 n=1 Tax=Erigeron canadensis TaxID=72917 RepID=UPI001CB9A702|nr:uncharacterized protein LOC122608994 [Erigeron canadensis]